MTSHTNRLKVLAKLPTVTAGVSCGPVFTDIKLFQTKLQLAAFLPLPRRFCCLAQSVCYQDYSHLWLQHLKCLSFEVNLDLDPGNRIFWRDFFFFFAIMRQSLFPLISLQMHKKMKKKMKLREIIYSLKNPKPINRFSLCLCGFYLAWQLHKTRLEVLSSLRTDLSITILKDLSGK